MFLRVAAIYEKNKKDKFEAVNVALHDKAEGKACLAIFENETLPQIIDEFTDGGVYVDSSPDASNKKAEYFIYVQHHAAFETQKEHVCVMVTNRKMYKKIGKDNDAKWEDLGELQFRRLLLNIHHVHVRGNSLKVTLDMIVHQTLNYIGKEINIAAIQHQVDETKRVLLEEVIPKVTQRGEMIEDLERETAKLADVSTLFSKNAADMNRTKCCGVSMPEMPYVPIINPAPILGPSNK